MNVFGAVSYERDGLHAGVREAGITRELTETLHRVLEGVDHSDEMLLVNLTCPGVITYIVMTTVM